MQDGCLGCRAFRYSGQARQACFLACPCAHSTIRLDTKDEQLSHYKSLTWIDSPSTVLAAQPSSSSATLLLLERHARHCSNDVQITHRSARKGAAPGQPAQKSPRACPGNSTAAASKPALASAAGPPVPGETPLPCKMARKLQLSCAEVCNFPAVLTVSLASLTRSACARFHKAACDESCHCFPCIAGSSLDSGLQSFWKTLYLRLRRQA